MRDLLNMYGNKKLNFIFVIVKIDFEDLKSDQYT
jgi:hypothetical protein